MSNISIWPIGRPCQVLPPQVRVDLGAMAVKRYSTFPKLPASNISMSYARHSLLRRYYLYVEMKSVYFTCSAARFPQEWVICHKTNQIYNKLLVSSLGYLKRWFFLIILLQVLLCNWSFHANFNVLISINFFFFCLDFCFWHLLYSFHLFQLCIRFIVLTLKFTRSYLFDVF